MSYFCLGFGLPVSWFECICSTISTSIELHSSKWRICCCWKFFEPRKQVLVLVVKFGNETIGIKIVKNDTYLTGIYHAALLTLYFFRSGLSAQWTNLTEKDVKLLISGITFSTLLLLLCKTFWWMQGPSFYLLKPKFTTDVKMSYSAPISRSYLALD